MAWNERSVLKAILYAAFTASTCALMAVLSTGDYLAPYFIPSAVAAPVCLSGLAVVSAVDRVSRS